MNEEPKKEETASARGSSDAAHFQVRPQTAGRYFASDYPLDVLWCMLSGGGGDDDDAEAATIAKHREYAFTFVDESTGEQRMRRHASFETFDEFATYVKKSKPYRIDVGGAYFVTPSLAQLYSCDPIDGAAVASEVGYKELTFDVDIDAYDKEPRRTCCRGRDWCGACWPILGIGCAAIDVGLRNLGAERVLWFFSGGRGMHCWVLDRALSIPDAAMRSVFVSYVAPSRLDASAYVSGCEEICDPGRMELLRLFVSDDLPIGGPYCFCRRDESAAPSSRCSLHAKDGFFLGWYARRHPDVAIAAILDAIARKKKKSRRESTRDASVAAIADLESMERELIAARSDVDVVAAALRGVRAECPPGMDLHVDSLFRGWNEGDPEYESASRVARLLSDVASRTRAYFSDANCGGSIARAVVGSVVCEAAFECLAPRVDIPVAIQTNHLLKAPMSIHPLTGRLAVPVDQNELLKFVPTDAPMVKRSEIEEASSSVFDCGEEAIAAIVKKFTRNVSETKRRCQCEDDDERRK